MRKPKKPYKSLKEIYLKESFARSVPILPHLSILGEANDEANRQIDVLARMPDGEPQIIGSVDQKGLTKIRNIVKSDINVKVFKEWVDACQLQGLEGYIYPVIEKYEIVWEEVKRLLVDGKHSNEMKMLLGGKIVGEEGRIELWKILERSITLILANQEVNDAINLFSELFDLSIPIGNVAIGKSEIVIALFTDGVKVKAGKEDATKGDILISDKRSIEIKVGEGRLYSSRSESGFKKEKGAAEQLVFKRLKGEKITSEEIKTVNPSFADTSIIEEVASIINNREISDGNLIESLIFTPTLLGYGKGTSGVGFTYLMIMNDKDRSSGNYYMTYYKADNKNLILNKILNQNLEIYSDVSGLFISSQKRPHGKKMYKALQPQTKKASATVKKPRLKKTSMFIPPERPPAVPLQPAQQPSIQQPSSQPYGNV